MGRREERPDPWPFLLIAAATVVSFVARYLLPLRHVYRQVRVGEESFDDGVGGVSCATPTTRCAWAVAAVGAPPPPPTSLVWRHSLGTPSVILTARC